MYNKVNFSISKLVPKSGHYMSDKWGLRVEPGCTVATDGHALIMVSTPERDIEDFPLRDEKAALAFEPFSISREDAEAIERAIPKKGPFPISDNVALLESPNGTATFMTAESSPTRKEAAKLDMHWPDFQGMFKKDEPVFRVGLGVELLETVLSVLKKAGVRGASFEFRGNDRSAVQFEAQTPDGQEIKGLIMPMKI